MQSPVEVLRRVGHLVTDQVVRPAHEPAQSSQSAHRFQWIPIRSLSERHRSRIRAHLLSLSPRDRYLRFGYPATESQIGRYIDALDFERDEIFGVFNRRLQLVAVAHLAYEPADRGAAAEAEFGVSVLPSMRGRGLGARLFDHAALHARNRGVDTLMIQALSENAPMLKIARKAGATLHRDGSESQACLKLPPESFVSHLGALVEDQVAELDYNLKKNARRVDDLLTMIGEVKEGVSHTGHTASE